MKDKLLSIVKHYGIRHQLKKLSEEVLELQEACIDYEWSVRSARPEGERTERKNHIKEELADVRVLLGQMMEVYKFDAREVAAIMEFKVDRQLKRMEEESIVNQEVQEN